MLYVVELDAIKVDRRELRRSIPKLNALGFPHEVIEQFHLFHSILSTRQQEHCTLGPYVSIPGAAEALTNLLSHGNNILYTTAQPESEKGEIRAWLENYGFPNYRQTSHYRIGIGRFVAAHTVAGRDEEIIFIDCMLERNAREFADLCRARPRIGYELMGRVELVGIGYNALPTLRSTLPTSVMRSWQEGDVNAWKAERERTAHARSFFGGSTL